MFEKYFTVMALLIVLRGLFIFPYIFIVKRTNLKYKNGSFILNKWFNSYDANTWRIFWASVLWLIVFYISYIVDLLEYVFPNIQSISLMI